MLIYSYAWLIKKQKVHKIINTSCMIKIHHRYFVVKTSPKLTALAWDQWVQCINVFQSRHQHLCINTKYELHDNLSLLLFCLPFSANFYEVESETKTHYQEPAKVFNISLILLQMKKKYIEGIKLFDSLLNDCWCSHFGVDLGMS